MLLSVKTASAGYGGTTILRDINIDVADREVVAIIGRNGAGKTTLMRAVVGLAAVTSGSIFFRDHDISGMSAATRARYGIGYVPQGRGIFAGLTVEQNLRMGEYVALYRGGRPRLHDLVVRTFPVLGERRRQKAGSLSGGEQQMLAIGRALVGYPDLLLLDEPSEGIQPSIIQEIERAVRGLVDELKLGVLLVEQNCRLIKAIADHCYAMETGTIRAHFTKKDYTGSDVLEQCLVLRTIAPASLNPARASGEGRALRRQSPGSREGL